MVIDSTVSGYREDKGTCQFYIHIHLFVLSDEYDAYIIVSFVNATLVLSIGETVEEVTDSGFLGTTPTLSCSQLGDDALVQVNDWSFCYLENRQQDFRPVITLQMTKF